MALTTTTLLNGLKSLFGASSSAPASTSRIPYCNSSNEVTGSTSLTDLASVLGGEHILSRTYNANYYHCRLGTVSSTSGALKILGLNTASCEDVIYLLFDKSVRYTKIFGHQHSIKDVYYVIPQSGDYVDIYFKHNSFTLTVYAIGSAEYVGSVSTIPAGAVAATADS